MKKFLSISCCLVIFTVIVSVGLVYADPADSTPTPTPTPASDQPTPTPTSAPDNSDQIQNLQKQIQELSGKVNDLAGKAKTLSNQIAVFDSQIQLTELRVASTKQEIASLQNDIQTATVKISTLENSLGDMTKALLNKIVATYEVGNTESLHLLLAADSISSFVTRVNYLRIAQAHDKRLIYDTVQAKNDYANQKEIFESKKKKVESLQVQLETYTAEINQEKDAKKNLLAETQGNEATYQRLLDQTRSQLAALSNFATSRAGGETIIGHTDISDGWGKYYNQRDASWGNNRIGYSSESIWQVGCLLTSYAMVATHFGMNVTPADIAATADYFALSTAWFKLPGPAPSGHSATYIGYPSNDTLKNEINNNNPVIAGLSKDGGSIADHWVVLRGVSSDGNFIINDPWYEHAMNVPLSDHYGGWTIAGARIYH